ncbi:BICD family-like cargo adapter 1 [Ambystoma mexicanum]|uniref:BICD family-like cargo adapter 1 n=1 Tax=Ambystoma mexicanum TaxID=8296 RepID=UPI0037E96136
MTDTGRWDAERTSEVASAQDGHRTQLQEAGDPPYLEAALEQKEEQLVLAAQLGKALLEENEELRAENRRLQERATHALQETEQQQYWLVQRSEGREKEWESRACELEAGMKVLQGELQRMQKALLEAEKERDGVKQSFGEQNHVLMEKLQQALQTGKALAAEVSDLRTECQDRALTEKWDASRILSLQEEVERESLQKLDLEQQISSVLQQNEVLQAQVEVLRTKVSALEKKSHELLDQLIQSQRDSEDMRMLNRTLRAQVEELQEEAFLTSSGDQNGSLLSEMEQSMARESWCSERQQVIAEIQAVRQELEACAGAAVPPCVTVAQSMLSELAQNLEDGVLANQDCETSLAERLQAQSQSLKDETERTLQLAIQERDDAITKKTAVEVELSRCRSELSSLNSQLLAAVQMKVQLSQELEAWQEDMQRVISEQIENQQRKEKTAVLEVGEIPDYLHRAKEKTQTDRKSFFSLFSF